VDTSAITTVTVDDDEAVMDFRETGTLNNRRWYSTGVVLPDGSVLAVNGADRDEVVAPGAGLPVTQLELFDPETETWSPAATQQNPRTYHSTAVLLPDGRVLVGGHAPISTLYGSNITIAPGVTTPQEGRDPSFEIYSPPYLFRGDRPQIHWVNHNIHYGNTFVVTTPDAADISSVMLVRNPSLTHLVDSDQRSVELPVLGHSGDALFVKAPPDGAVAPPGSYMLFINADSPQGPIPSVSSPVTIGAVPGNPGVVGA
jgi:hypothetical protein